MVKQLKLEWVIYQLGYFRTGDARFDKNNEQWKYHKR